MPALRPVYSAVCRCLQDCRSEGKTTVVQSSVGCHGVVEQGGALNVDWSVNISRPVAGSEESPLHRDRQR